MREKHELLGRQAGADLGVRNAAAAKRYEVFCSTACLQQAAIELKRKVLVEQDLQAALTAGGW